MSNLLSLKMKEANQFFFSLSKTELVFFLSTLLMAWGFIHFDVESIQFAKIGISIKGEAKLFITEMYMLLLFSLCLLNFSEVRRQFSNAIFSKNFLLYLIFLFILFGFVRMAFGFFDAPILSIRNACFVWYFFITLFVFFLPMSRGLIEKIAFLVQLIAFLYFSFSIVPSLLFATHKVYWIPFIGVAAPFALALVTESYLLSAIIIFPICYALFSGYWMGFQRTSLLGMLLVFIGALLFQKEKRKRVLSRFLFAVFLLILCINIFPLNRETMSVSAFSPNPLEKSASDQHGLEHFRSQMWKDAWGLFMERPFSGIGFQRQVVYRIYYADGQLIPNDGKRLLPFGPPVSGPHNSYLNAMARMGILGVLILIIHLIALNVLYKAKYWSAFFLLFSGVLYAMFSVGLEGPVRSFLLLLSLGLAMKIYQDSLPCKG